MDTIFTVKNEDLDRYNPQEAVYMFSELLWSEARRIGFAISRIHISSKINVSDGGIDAVVEENNTSTRSDLIKATLTGFQIKTGASFEPWQDSQIKKELFGKRKPCIENLGTSIKECLDKDGTYVLVCFGQDLVASQYEQAINSLQNYFAQCGYSNPRTEIWSQNNLIGFLNVFPSLALKVNGRDSQTFQSHDNWSKEAEMRKEFFAGQAQKEFMSNMQNELCNNSGETVHIRVCGEPGIGKTRLVLEATKMDNLQPLVIYSDSANKFRDSDLMNKILSSDNQFYTILVVDECGPENRSYIWNKLQSIGQRIKLISIYSDFEDTSGSIKYLDAPPLENEQIASIIHGYGIPVDQAEKWSHLCSGSPRVAHVIGYNLTNNPDDLLKSPDTVNVWDRYIVGDNEPTSQDVQQKQLVLRHIALYKRFGYKQPLTTEAQIIAQKVERDNPQITWSRFQEIINALMARKILQGEYTLYITPKALHIQKWIEWWSYHGSSFNIDDFLKDIPENSQLRKWFYEMFEYAKESDAALKIVEDLLGEHGPFKNEN